MIKKIIFFPLIVALSVVFLVPGMPVRGYSAEQQINLEELWRKTITEYLNKIDVKNSVSLYAAQPDLMVPAWASFRLNKRDWQHQFTVKFSEILGHATPISKLKEMDSQNFIQLDPKLMDAARNGKGTRLIFPFEKGAREKTQAKKGQVFEEVLSQFQFSYLLAYHSRKLVETGAKDPDTLNYLQKVVPFLKSDIVRAYWLEIPAWHWAVKKLPYPNIKERLKAKLCEPLQPELRGKKYFRLIMDEDLFIMAIAAELKCISLIDGGKYFDRNDVLLMDEIQDYCLKTMNARLSKGKGFLFDVGARDDRPDFAYAGYTGSVLPTGKKRPAKMTVSDVSHAQRWPWWLTSFRDSWPKDSDNYKKFDRMIDRLAVQFGEYVVSWQPNGYPLLNNFLDGRNGWYRVGYQKRKNFGYGPYELSHIAMRGNWGILAERNTDVRRFNIKISELLLADGPEVKKFRETYYLKREDQKDFAVLIAILTAKALPDRPGQQ